MENFVQIRELMLMEEFKKCLPEKIVVYLNEQKVETLSKAAVRADEFVLRHRAVFPSVRRENVPYASSERNQFVSPKSPRRAFPVSSESRECFYCHEAGHLIAVCPALQKKERYKGPRSPKSVGFVQSVSTAPTPHTADADKPDFDESYRPFISHGSVSLTGGRKRSGANCYFARHWSKPVSSAPGCFAFFE